MSDKSPETYKLRGEYWIEDDNQLTFADGDVGEYHHEGVALRAAQQKVSDALGLDDDEIESEGFVPVVEAHLDENLPGWNSDPRFKLNNVSRGIQRLCEQDNRELSMMEINTACEMVKDAREVAVKEWGWVSVRQNHITLWDVSPERLDKVHRAMGEAFFEEGIDLTAEMEAGVNLEVFIVSTQKSIFTSLADLKERSATLLPEIPSLEAAGKIAFNQLATMDKDRQHPSYRRKLGD